MSGKKKDKTKRINLKPVRPKPAADQVRPGPARRFWRYVFVLALVGLVTVAWLSVLTFSPTDPPAPTVSPPRLPVANAAGRVGAFLAYHLLYWLGGGVYMAMLFGSIAAVIMMLGGRIGDLPWRIVGLVVLVTATSAAVYLANPASAADVYRGSAGVLGLNVGQFLLSKFSGAAWVFVTIAFLIGLMFAADSLVLRLPGWGRKVWQKRGELPAMASVFRPSGTRSAGELEATSRALRRKMAAAAAMDRKRAATAVPPDRPSAPAAKSASFRTSPVEPPPGPARGAKKYDLPSKDLLAKPIGGYLETQKEAAQLRQEVLEQLLSDFNVAAEVAGHMTGPVITMYELSLAAGVKVSQVAGLATDIARALAVPGVRIVPPRFGKDTVGIEVPNLQKEIVRIRDLMEMCPDAETKMHLPLYLGKDAAGEPLVADLAAMPHVLIAGTTGSGKSVCINAILMSMLMTRRPEDVRLILIDPKMVEMAAFESIPHLLCPIVNDMRKAEDILEWAAMRMDERYEMLKEAGVRNIASYNRLGAEELHRRLRATTPEERARIPLRIPHYVIIVDELADLMMTYGKEVESYIIRIAQKARAVGIHLVMATQRPSVDVVTGLIKSNMPCRISFRVASRQESRIVLDQNGAEVLLGQGDMLFLQPGTSSLMRAQGAFVDDTEIRPVVKQLRQAGQPEYNRSLMELQSSPSGAGGEKDELFDKAVEIILGTQRGSVSLLQRRLQVGYSRASRIIDQMADAGLLGDYKGSQARECLMTLEEWQALQQSIRADQSGSAALDGTPTSA